MITTVVNLKQLSSNWILDNTYVYIGRIGKGFHGYFGNPIERGKPCMICGKTHREAGDTLPCFQILFNKRIQNDSEFKNKILELKGKKLVCFCRPVHGFKGKLCCHGQIYAAYCDNVDPININ